MGKTVYLDLDEMGSLTVTFKYNPDLVVKIKSLGGARWNPEKKYWVVGYTEEKVRRLQSLFAEEEVLCSQALGSKMGKTGFELSKEQDSLLKKVQEELKLINYSPRTRKAYINHLKRYLYF